MCSDSNLTKYVDNATTLSVDLIVEILSFLPVKSLLRFKCVCRSWYAIIQENYFIEKHMMRAKHYWVYDDCEEFKLLSYIHGLVLEKNNSSGKYRVRNPMTKKVLDIPDPLGLGEEILAIWMFHVPTSQNYKLFCLCCKPRSLVTNCKVLTIGTDFEWRKLDSPSFRNLSNMRDTTRPCSWLKHDDLLFVVKCGAPEICCIDVVRECVVSLKVPTTLILSGWGDDVITSRWEDKFSLSKLERKNLLRGWVLEDYKKQKWIEKKVILDFMNVYPDTTSKNILLVDNNWLWVNVDENGEHVLAYHLEYKEVCIHAHYRSSLNYRTSLVYLKGMETEETNAEGKIQNQQGDQ